MLDASYVAIEQRVRVARREGKREAEVIALTALTHLLESTLQAINSHVDAAILVCHDSARDGGKTVAETRLQREDRLKALEDRFKFRRAELPGWTAVKLTNDQTNAVKHRLGFTYRRASEGRLSIADGVSLDDRELLLRLDEVHEWILALGRNCGLISAAT
jgi:hypothetical protein